MEYSIKDTLHDTTVVIYKDGNLGFIDENQGLQWSATKVPELIQFLINYTGGTPTPKKTGE